MSINFKIATGIVILSIGLLALLFFRHYSGVIIPYPFLWYIVGFILILIGGVLVKNGFSENYKQSQDNLQNEINKFKQTADRILVNLDNCKIKSNNYSEEVDADKSNQSQAFDAVFDSEHNTEIININQAVLEFETEYNGAIEKFYSSIINKDEVTIRFLIYNQKETFIYIDKRNRKKYYFDIEFLLK